MTALIESSASIVLEEICLNSWIKNMVSSSVLGKERSTFGDEDTEAAEDAIISIMSKFKNNDENVHVS